MPADFNIGSMAITRVVSPLSVSRRVFEVGLRIKRA